MNVFLVWFVLLLFTYAFATLLAAARDLDIASGAKSGRGRVRTPKTREQAGSQRTERRRQAGTMRFSF